MPRTFKVREQTYDVDGRSLVARVEPLFLDESWNAVVARFSLQEKGSKGCLLGGSSSPLARVPDFMSPSYIQRTYSHLPLSAQQVYDFFVPLTRDIYQ